MSDVAKAFEETLGKLSSLGEAKLVDPHKLDEAVARLKALKIQYVACMQVHDHLQHIARSELAVAYDPSREAFVQYVDGKIVELVKLERNDPNIPLEVSALGLFTSFVPGTSLDQGTRSDETADLELQLSANVEAFYTAASRWWQLFEGQIVGRAKPEFIGVQMVRNKLVEHADKTFVASEPGVIYSFGTHTEHGPIVKPARFTAQTNEYQDAGLTPNVLEMLSICVDRLSKLRGS